MNVPLEYSLRPAGRAVKPLLLLALVLGLFQCVVPVTGNEAPHYSAISVYPNPCNGRFFIQTNGSPIKDLKIYDSIGKSQIFDTVTNNNLTIVDLKTITSGTYFIILHQESKTLIVKVIIN